MIEPLPFLNFIVDKVNMGVAVVDKNCDVLLWNHFMATNSCIVADQAIGKNLFDLFPELPVAFLKRKIQSIFMLKNFAFTSWQQRPYLFKFDHNRPITSDVEHMRQDCTFMPIKDDNSNVLYVCITIQDVTDASIYQSKLKDALYKLEESSRIDGLTQIANRTYWEQVLYDEFARSKRYSQILSLIMFDLDHFKSINDTYGHLVGDQVLRTVSNIIKTLTRDSDLIGRYGGEEFGIILPNTDTLGARKMAERIREEVSQEIITLNEIELTVTISVGVAQVDEKTSSPSMLIEHADQGLYMSKRSGRNKVSVYNNSQS